MTRNLAVVMDPIENIHFKKDTTLALLLEAQKRDWVLFYLQQKDLFVKDGIAWGQSSSLRVFDNPDRWFELKESHNRELASFDLILMRKDPPFDMEYIYTTYILEFAKFKGVKVVNDPQSLRDANEKLFAQWFPQCMPPTMVTKKSRFTKTIYR